MQSGEVTKLYDAYPETFGGFAEWKAKAEKLWSEIGKLSDDADEEIMSKI